MVLTFSHMNDARWSRLLPLLSSVWSANILSLIMSQHRGRGDQSQGKQREGDQSQREGVVPDHVTAHGDGEVFAHVLHLRLGVRPLEEEEEAVCFS